MVALDEDESSASVSLSGHDILGLNGVELCELVDPNVSRTLFEVVLV